MDEKLLDEILSAPTIPEITQYGKCVKKGSAPNGLNEMIDFAVYEYLDKTYLAQYLNGENISFSDISNQIKTN